MSVLYGSGAKSIQITIATLIVSVGMEFQLSYDSILQIETNLEGIGISGRGQS